MLTRYDIQSMTDGQREILYLGMKMREDEIMKLLESLKDFETYTPQRVEHMLALEVMITKLRTTLTKGEH